MIFVVRMYEGVKLSYITIVEVCAKVLSLQEIPHSMSVI